MADCDARFRHTQFTGKYPTAEELRRLREMGVRIALDDFGTGYSSLHHLQEIKADVLKIDREFIERLGTAYGNPVTRLQVFTGESRLPAGHFIAHVFPGIVPPLAGCVIVLAIGHQIGRSSNAFTKKSGECAGSFCRDTASIDIAHSTFLPTSAQLLPAGIRRKPFPAQFFKI